MRPVRRDEIVDYQTYEEEREAFRARVLEQKRARRVHLGEFLTFLFENHDTIRYQIQEMIRAERIVKEADIRHEIDTYNQLLGGEGELGCTLLIEIPDPERRPELLARWRALPERVYLRLADGRRVSALYDPAQVGEERLSSVQYLKFNVGAGEPVAVGVEGLPDLDGEAEFDEATRVALRQDLGLG
ncbi:MAG: DUF3501 family protein [Planctomycetota bacterium]|nr:MAG: DUF3501 family protein [Planctomycetota bacterium]